MFIVRAMMTGVFIATSIGGVFGSQPVINPTTYREFRSQVQNAIKNERFELYEPQVGWFGDRLNVTFVAYDFSDHADDARWLCVNEQLRVESIRRFRMNNRQQREFWTPVLTEVEGEIAALNAIARRTDDNADVLQITERINSIYQTHLDRLAKQQGREGASLASVAGATTLTVDLPEGGEAKYMSHGKYLVYMAYAQGQAPDWLASDWTDALPGAIIGVASLSYFIAKWPDGYERRYKVQPPQSSRNNLRLRRSGAFWSTR